MEYNIYMERCIELAKIAKERGDSPVGSVIVSGDKIIAEGIEANKSKRDVTCHAEIEALRGAVRIKGSNDLSDCVLITTHEPCLMCSYAIRFHKISKVVFGISTGEIGGYSSNYPILIATDIKRWCEPPVIVVGVMKEKCQEI